MTVAELIDALRGYPRSHEVWLMVRDHADVLDRVTLDSQSGTVDLFGEEA